MLPACRAVVMMSARQLAGRLTPKIVGSVHPLTDGLHHAGLDFAQDIKAGVCHHGFGNGHDNGQLLGSDVHVVPRLLARLLEAGIAVDPVSHGQHVQHGDAGLLAGHVGQLAGQPHKYGLLGRVLLDGVDQLLLDERFRLLAGNHVRHSLCSFLILRGRRKTAGPHWLLPFCHLHPPRGRSDGTSRS